MCFPLSSRRQTKAVVPNIFGTRDKVHGKQFFHGLGVVAVVVEQQPRSLACAVHSRVYIPMSI